MATRHNGRCRKSWPRWKAPNPLSSSAPAWPRSRRPFWRWWTRARMWWQQATSMAAPTTSSIRNSRRSACPPRWSIHMTLKRSRRPSSPNTQLLYFEVITNPVLKVVDIPGLVEIARRHNLRLVVDSTFAPPPVMRPLELGVDVVIHSASKYLNGHSDLIAGVRRRPAQTDRYDLAAPAELRWLAGPACVFPAGTGPQNPRRSACALMRKAPRPWRNISKAIPAWTRCSTRCCPAIRITRVPSS